MCSLNAELPCPGSNQPGVKVNKRDFKCAICSRQFPHGLGPEAPEHETYAPQFSSDVYGERARKEWERESKT